MKKVTVIGAGLAGCECAYQLAKRGIKVDLYEMKPKKRSEAHSSDNFCELVCSNSLRSNDICNAVGLLKEEMRLLDSLIMRCADENSVKAGGALAVDRDLFSKAVTEEIKQNKNINVIVKEVEEINFDNPIVIASGPLTSDKLSLKIKELLGEEYLYFFDAAAPIVTHESIDFEKTFIADRYNKGDSDYVNCPLNKEEYQEFYNELITAQTAKLKGFENENVFEGCMPVEVIAKRGEDTLRFGPMKPVGLYDPKTNKKPYAVVQLRKENAEGTMYNLVGFQTHLTFSEQKRVFGLIPALKNAEIVRFGVMHRNTFINSPKVLTKFYSMKKNLNVFFAGQISGVEGYVESTASGLNVAINVARMLDEKPMIDFSCQTAIGALSHHISNSISSNFQPMNVNFSLISPIEEIVKDKKVKKQMIAQRAIAKIKEIITDLK